MHIPRPAGGALAIVAVLLFSGCDANRPPVSTAPQPDAAVPADDMPQEFKASIFMSADAEGSAEVSRTADVSRSADADRRREVARSPRLGDPLAGLDPADLARFTDGQNEFKEIDDVKEGLGPVFNEASCGTCHDGPLGGTTGRVETRFGRLGPNGFDPMAEQGGSLIQDHAIGLVRVGDQQFIYVPEIVPAAATVKTGRLTTPLFGLGLVDAVSDATLLELARLESRNLPATQGTPNLVAEISTGATRVGRFGWKAQVPTLHQFSGDAYLNEMGITNPDFPEENAPQGNRDALAFNPFPTLNDDGGNVDKFFDFMRLLAPPPRGQRSFATEAGGAVFVAAGCANCHTPTLVTGDSPVPALSNKVFHPYSDFLLHDMGTLGDGIVQGQATGRQMRTAPLWGLSARPSFLHDGRAKTPQAAILEHGGQGISSRNRYLRMRGYERHALLEYLRSL
jgi:mono/diheme cytochrome c family protein